MKIQFQPQALVTILKEVSRIVPTSTSRQALKHVLISVTSDRVDFYSSGEAVSMRRTLFNTMADSPITIETTGSVLLPARELFAMVKLAKDKVTLEDGQEPLETLIRFEKTKFSMMGLNPEEFTPYDSKDSTTTSIAVVASELKKVLRRTRYASSNSEARPMLTAVHLSSTVEGLSAEATDGLQLARTKIEGHLEGEEKSIPVSATLMDYLSSVLPNDDDEEVSIVIGSTAITASWDDDSTRLAIRALAEGYPDLDRIIPKQNQFEVVVNREELLLSAEKMLILFNDGPNKDVMTKISFGTDTLRLYSKVQKGDSQDEIAVSGKGPNFPMLVNPKYIVDGMKALDGIDNVIIGITEQNKPITFRPEQGEGMGLFAPVQYREIETNAPVKKAKSA